MSTQLGAGEQTGHQITGNRLAVLVHEDGAIRVPVEADTEVCAGASYGLPNVGEILDLERVRGVIGKGAVRIEVEPLDLEIEAIEQRREPHRRHAVPAVDGDAERGTALADGESVLDVVRHHVHPANPPRCWLTVPSWRRFAGRRFDLIVFALDLLQSAGLTDGDRILPADLEAVVLGGVVGCGQHDPPTGPEPIDGEVQHRGRHHPDVHHLDALIGHATHQGFEKRGRARARIATDHQLGRRQEAGGRPTDPVGILRTELIRNHSTDVVGLEYGHGWIVTTPDRWDQPPG